MYATPHSVQNNKFGYPPFFCIVPLQIKVAFSLKRLKSAVTSKHLSPTSLVMFHSFTAWCELTEPMSTISTSFKVFYIHRY